MLSYSNVLATIAVFVALGGSSYAAVTQIARNSVSSEQVRDRSLVARDFKRGQLKAGPAGSQGPAGPAGPVGAAGPAGQVGAGGPAGPVGPQGPAGPPGPTGAKGASGVIGVLGFQGEWSPLNLPGNNGNTIVKPSVCQTATYTAGSGDVAVIAFSATGSPNAPVTDVLYISAMVSENGGQFQPKNTVDAAESLQDGTAHPTINLRYPLEAGKSYVFAAGLATNAAVSITPGYCQGTVMIVHT